MSDLPPSRRDERAADLRDIEAFAKAVKDGALEARFAMPNIPTILGGLVGEIRLLSQQIDEARFNALTEAADIANAAREEVSDPRQIRDRILILRGQPASPRA